jgi:hypothetical protein
VGQDFKPDFKAPPRVVDDEAGRAKVRAEGRCRVCKRVPSGHHLDSLNRMHVVPKGVGGDDVDDNIVPGCGSGGTGCHGLLTSRREDPHHPAGLTVAEAQLRLREGLDKAERAYAVRAKWAGWLESYYPGPAASAA